MYVNVEPQDFTANDLYRMNLRLQLREYRYGKPIILLEAIWSWYRVGFTQ